MHFREVSEKLKELFRVYKLYLFLYFEYRDCFMSRQRRVWSWGRQTHVVNTKLCIVNVMQKRNISSVCKLFCHSFATSCEM